MMPFLGSFRFLTFGALEGLPDLRMDRGADQKLDFIYKEFKDMLIGYTEY
jgi:hypothetical protein